MFAKRFVGIIAVHNDEVLWIAGRSPEAGRCVLRLPLTQVLAADGVVAGQIPKMFQGPYKTLCIVPDHWFGTARYPFQSTRPALIEPFLERKLIATFPERRQVRHFFNYTHLGAAEAEGLLTYFLQDEKGYQLYHALAKMDAAPRLITSPAFLWKERLAQAAVGFHREGTLLIHMGSRECMLYFYFKGNFVFSRDVVLSEAQDRLEALTFEINQSLYMFSQKTKSELSRVYLLACASDSCEMFAQVLGREVIDLRPLLENAQTMAIEAAPFLDGALRFTDLSYQAPYFSITHRRVKQELEWEPVQWAGILVGALLLLPLAGENWMLGQLQRREIAEQQMVQQRMVAAGAGMGQYEQALDSVLAVTEKPACGETLRRVMSSLPSGVQLQALNIALEEQPALTLNASVQAQDSEQLKSLLEQLVARLKKNLGTRQEISIHNINISVDAAEEADRSQKYLIAMRLELT